LQNRIILLERNLRHARHVQPPGSSLPAGDDSIITSLGGNSSVLAFYDGRSGVATSGANVTSWADVRGSVGFGPSLTATGTPTFASNKVSFGAGTDLHSATTSLFTLTTPGSLLIACSNAGGANIAGIAPSAAAATIINPGDNGTDYSIWTDHTTCISTVVVGTTIIPYVCSWDGNTAVTLQIPNQTLISGNANGTYTAGNCSFTLGGFFANNGDNGNIVVTCAIIVNHQVNATETNAFRDYAVAQQGATAQ